jgi:hypothetical protein
MRHRIMAQGKQSAKMTLSTKNASQVKGGALSSTSTLNWT